ncbi:M50 family peptidase [Profundibacter amoris]|uniref:M50 family peptidase n=2 Tax=Profundibacter amoris TaxID=2171755 RepID=A0A347UHX6_9RHOB|nr:M50 family peptidase [Profundibacter amoris]
MKVVRGHWQMLVITAAIFLLWFTPVIIPLKILIVFFHELSHALAAWITGGSVESIRISPQQGGVTVTRGGNVFLLMSAGYLGSLLIGVLLFLGAVRSHADRIMMAVLGAVMLLIAALYIRDVFALAFITGGGVLMLVVARFLSRDVNDLVLRVVGLTSMIYVPMDIFSDTIARSEMRSDAYMLADRFGGATMMWGGLWLLVSLVVIGLCLRYGLGRHSNISNPRETPST